MNHPSRIIIVPILALSVFITATAAQAQSFLYDCSAPDRSSLVVEVVFPRYGTDKVSAGRTIFSMTEWPLDRAATTEIDGTSYSCYTSKSSEILPKEAERYCLSQEFYNGLTPAHLHYRKSVRHDLLEVKKTEGTYSCHIK